MQNIQHVGAGVKDFVRRRRWTEAFHQSPEALADLAAEALAEQRAGRTLPPACA